MLTFSSIARESRATLALAIPMAAGQLGQMLLGFSDSLMVGQLGVVPLAASAFANGIISVLLVAGIGLLASVSILAAQAYGAGRARESGEIMRQGVGIAVVSGLLIGALIQLSLPFLDLFQQPPAVLAAAKPFLVIVGWSIAPALVWQSLKQFCEALSRPLVPMLTMFAAVALNVFLSWTLIYGHFGLPRLGLAGAGWATLISRLVFTAALFAVVLRSPHFRAALPPRWMAPVRWQAVRTQLAIGLPVALQLLAEVGAFATAAVMMGWLGADALAAHQVAISYCALTFMLPLGVSMAVSIRVGQVLGAREWERLRIIMAGGILMALALMGTFALVFAGAGGVLAGLFIRDLAVAGLAARFLGVAAIFQLFDGLQVVTAGALRGMSDVRVPTGIAFGAYWVVALPVCYLAGFVLKMGSIGVWWGLALGLAAAAVALLWRLYVKTRPAGLAETGEIVAAEFSG